MNFFIVFSRFEYALKRAKYIKGEKHVSADWDKFADEISSDFNRYQTRELREAARYLESNPPKKQIAQGGELSWEDIEHSTSKTLTKWLLRLVRTVRNNLFHGGKFPGLPVEEPSRNSKLIQSSIVILDACLALHPEVKGYFLEQI